VLVGAGGMSRSLYRGSCSEQEVTAPSWRPFAEPLRQNADDDTMRSDNNPPGGVRNHGHGRVHRDELGGPISWVSCDPGFM